MPLLPARNGTRLPHGTTTSGTSLCRTRSKCEQLTCRIGISHHSLGARPWVAKENPELNEPGSEPFGRIPRNEPESPSGLEPPRASYYETSLGANPLGASLEMSLRALVDWNHPGPLTTKRAWERTLWAHP